jgi:hypothetical protein
MARAATAGAELAAVAAAVPALYLQLLTNSSLQYTVVRTNETVHQSWHSTHQVASHSEHRYSPQGTSRSGYGQLCQLYT